MATKTRSETMGTPWIVTLVVAAFAGGIAMSDTIMSGISRFSFSQARSGSTALVTSELPALAQLMLPVATVVLPVVPPPNEANATTIFVPPGASMHTLMEKPFHVMHPDFLEIIGESPTLTLIADSGTNPMFHEAVVWHPDTDEVFFAQNAGAKAAGTGLHLSSVIQKVSLDEVMPLAFLRNSVGKVQVKVVDFDPPVINPNGGTNYRGNMIFAGEGMGPNIPPALYLANPVPPYNTTVLINNYYGRQFNSVNDLAVHPVNGDIYFTDVTYGYLQDFRPKPVLPNQVYRLDAVTKAVIALADDIINPNGITFSPDGKYAYVTETGPAQGFYGYNDASPSGIYRYTVAKDGTFEHRKLFAHVTSRIADGVHCDTKGNVYSGCGDGIHVWNPSGVLLGKIFTGEGAANFQFAGDGRMVICGETHLYYATLDAKGAALT